MPSVKSLRTHFQRSGLAQFLLICTLWLAGQVIATLTGLPIPGAVLGLGLTLALLATKVLVLPDLDRAAGWLISEMLLFFVPAVLALLAHPEFLGWLGLKLLAVIVVSTVTVMLATATVVEVASRLQSGLQK
jgi:holin-like protein